LFAAQLEIEAGGEEVPEHEAKRVFGNGGSDSGANVVTVIVQSAGICELVVLKAVGPLDHFIEIDIAEDETVGCGLDLRAGSSLTSRCVDDRGTDGRYLKCKAGWSGGLRGWAGEDQGQKSS